MADQKADKGSERIFTLLKQLQDEGASVRAGGKSGSALTAATLRDAQASPDFDAWVSWTKSF